MGGQKNESFPKFLLFFVISVIPVPSMGNRDLPVALPLSGRSRGCSFDDTWNGSWFEYGERESVSVGANNGSMSHKGQCLLRKGDKYLFEDRSHNCFRCAVMHLKHENVIQYKESFCETQIGNKRRPMELCYTITADSPLKSLFRLKGQTSACPIKANHFQMTYSRGTGLCEYPKSSVNKCPGQHDKMVFHYQACADIVRTESSTEEVECLGSWKEGSTFYFLGLMNHSRVTSEDWEGRFRCFAYREIYEGYLLAQSGEAKCNLFSATEGDRTMTLKKVAHSHEKCVFPAWLYTPHHQYRNLNGSVKYHFNQQGTGLTVSSPDRSNDNVGQHYKCMTTLKEDPMNNFTQIILETHVQCESRYVCLEARARTENILSVRFGKISRDKDEACNKNLFFDSDSAKQITLLSTSHFHARCPLVGRYLVQSDEKQSEHQQQSSSSFLLRQSALDSSSSSSSSTSSASSSSSTCSQSLFTFGCSGESIFKAEEREKNALECQHEMDLDLADFTCLGSWPSLEEEDEAENQLKRNSETITINIPTIKAATTTTITHFNNSSTATKKPQGIQYWILSQRNRKSSNKNHKVVLRVDRKLCAKLQPLDNDHKLYSLVTSADECPGINQESTESTTKWKLIAQSAGECAQALATANSAILNVLGVPPVLLLPGQILLLCALSLLHLK